MRKDLDLLYEKLIEAAKEFNPDMIKLEYYSSYDEYLNFLDTKMYRSEELKTLFDRALSVVRDFENFESYDEETGNLTFKTKTGVFAFTYTSFLRIYKKFPKKELTVKSKPSNNIQAIINRNERHLKFIKWFKFIKANDLTLEIEKARKFVSELEPVTQHLWTILRHPSGKVWNKSGHANKLHFLSNEELPNFINFYETYH